VAYFKLCCWSCSPTPKGFELVVEFRQADAQRRHCSTTLESVGYQPCFKSLDSGDTYPGRQYHRHALPPSSIFGLDPSSKSDRYSSAWLELWGCGCGGRRLFSWKQTYVWCLCVYGGLGSMNKMQIRTVDKCTHAQMLLYQTYRGWWATRPLQ